MKKSALFRRALPLIAVGAAGLIAARRSRGATVQRHLPPPPPAPRPPAGPVAEEVVATTPPAVTEPLSPSEQPDLPSGFGPAGETLDELIIDEAVTPEDQAAPEGDPFLAQSPAERATEAEPILEQEPKQAPPVEEEVVEEAEPEPPQRAWQPREWTPPSERSSTGTGPPASEIHTGEPRTDETSALEDTASDPPKPAPKRGDASITDIVDDLLGPPDRRN